MPSIEWFALGAVLHFGRDTGSPGFSQRSRQQEPEHVVADGRFEADVFGVSGARVCGDD